MAVPIPYHVVHPNKWFLVAGGMPFTAQVGAHVTYFPSGHLENSGGDANFSIQGFMHQHYAPSFPLQVSGVEFLVDRNTEEVFALVNLFPIGFSAWVRLTKS